MLQGVEVAAVIADRAARTPKYLYGVIRGCPILKPAHLQVHGILFCEQFVRGAGANMVLGHRSRVGL